MKKEFDRVLQAHIIPSSSSQYYLMFYLKSISIKKPNQNPPQNTAYQFSITRGQHLINYTRQPILLKITQQLTLVDKVQLSFFLNNFNPNRKIIFQANIQPFSTQHPNPLGSIELQSNKYILDYVSKNKHQTYEQGQIGPFHVSYLIFINNNRYQLEKIVKKFKQQSKIDQIDTLSEDNNSNQLKNLSNQSDSQLLQGNQNVMTTLPKIINNQLTKSADGQKKYNINCIEPKLQNVKQSSFPISQIAKQTMITESNHKKLPKSSIQDELPPSPIKTLKQQIKSSNSPSSQKQQPIFLPISEIKDQVHSSQQLDQHLFTHLVPMISIHTVDQDQQNQQFVDVNSQLYSQIPPPAPQKINITLKQKPQQLSIKPSQTTTPPSIQTKQQKPLQNIFPINSVKTQQIPVPTIQLQQIASMAQENQQIPQKQKNIHHILSEPENKFSQEKIASKKNIQKQLVSQKKQQQKQKIQNKNQQKKKYQHNKYEHNKEKQKKLQNKKSNKNIVIKNQKKFIQDQYSNNLKIKQQTKHKPKTKNKQQQINKNIQENINLNAKKQQTKLTKQAKLPIQVKLPTQAKQTKTAKQIKEAKQTKQTKQTKSAKQIKQTKQHKSSPKQTKQSKLPKQTKQTKQIKQIKQKQQKKTNQLNQPKLPHQKTHQIKPQPQKQPTPHQKTSPKTSPHATSANTPQPPSQQIFKCFEKQLQTIQQSIEQQKSSSNCIFGIKMLVFLLFIVGIAAYCFLTTEQQQYSIEQQITTPQPIQMHQLQLLPQKQPQKQPQNTSQQIPKAVPPKRRPHKKNRNNRK